MKGNKLKVQITDRINQSKGAVFIARDFLDLSGRNQVGRILREIVREGVIIRFGLGLLAKAVRSTALGNLIPLKPLPELAREALTEEFNVDVVQRYTAWK
jgi:hypothetical protein